MNACPLEERVAIVTGGGLGRVMALGPARAGTCVVRHRLAR